MTVTWWEEGTEDLKPELSLDAKDSFGLIDTLEPLLLKGTMGLIRLAMLAKSEAARGSEQNRERKITRHWRAIHLYNNGPQVFLQNNGTNGDSHKKLFLKFPKNVLRGKNICFPVEDQLE